jgi:dTDP-4-dehydrorhamnose 3,5-epimerase
VLVVEPDIHRDNRGFFKETYQMARYREIGIQQEFVQDNVSRSERGVLRGLHFQKKRPQGKLVSCLNGSVFDVAVDIDKDSKTYGHWYGAELSGTNHLQLWIPPGYAHGFCVLSDVADFCYKCTGLYDPSDEEGIIWNDPFVGVEWPISVPILSEKDKSFSTLTRMDAIR